MTSETLAPEEIRALEEALDDEHKAWATYDQVIRDFGPVRPFVNIRDAEARHIGALERLHERFGMPIPTNPWPGRVKRYESLLAACADGVAGEIENAALYDRLLAAVRHEDVRQVLGNLRAASQERHLPAFRRCVARGGRPGRGPGGGRGDGPDGGPGRRRGCCGD
ncbi:MAG: hypothetical protein V2J24_10590 [Pseudomonadales bacterium]|jgi:rubrerythrin|nr:hypothetical protein [Pseudomonadales bacterium]